jgi:DNA repair exonuclease SbcCD nuclease subunit
MIHAFLHIGDAHLAPGPRQADRLHSLDQILAHGNVLADRGQLSAWIWPGDLFHGRSTVEDRNLLVRYVMTMATVAPVCICPGNHDAPGDLEFLRYLQTQWPVYVWATPGLHTIDLASGLTDFTIYVLPYPHRAQYASAAALNEQLLTVAYARPDLVMPDLVMAHVNVAGSLASTGQPQIGRELEVTAHTLAQFRSSHGVEPYIALNHIHKHQAFRRDPEEGVDFAVYAGSISRMDYGEMDPKGFVQVDYDGTYFKSWTFVPLDVAPQYHVEGELTQVGFQWPTNFIEPPESWAGADVRVRYSYHAAERALLNFDLVSAPFVAARSVKLEPTPFRDRETRAPEIAAAVTLEAKVEAYCARMGLIWSAALKDKLAELVANHE